MSMNWQNKYRLTIKRPSGAAKSFDIILDIKGPEGNRTQKSIKTEPRYTEQIEALASLNRAFKKGSLSALDVEVDIKTNILPAIEKILFKGRTVIRDTVIRKANGGILDDLWSERYAHRKIIDKQRTRNTFEFALDCLNDESLSTVTQAALQKLWDTHEKLQQGTAHRRYGRAINSLMKYIGRPIRLQLEHNAHREMRYPTLEELFRLSDYFEDRKLKALVVTMFCTGVREGEAFALSTKSLRSNSNVYIEAQIDRNLDRRQVKNRNKHAAVIIPEGLDLIKEWLALPQDEKNEFRFLVSRRISEAAEATLDRRLSSHDMRHGYAVHLLDKGVPIDRLAQFLGDTPDVTMKHYASFIASDFAIASVAELLKK